MVETTYIPRDIEKLKTYGVSASIINIIRGFLLILIIGFIVSYIFIPIHILICILYTLTIIALIRAFYAVKIVSRILGLRRILLNYIMFFTLTIVGATSGLFIVNPYRLAYVWTKWLRIIVEFWRIDVYMYTYTDFSVYDLLSFCIVYSLILIAIIFLKESYSLISRRSGITYFEYTALLYLLAVALILIGIGCVLFTVAATMELISWITISEYLTKSSTEIHSIH